MKKYQVDENLRFYIRHILIRCFYRCRMFADENGVLWCDTNADPDTFRRVVERAKCEKKEKETGLFFVTAEEAKDSAYLAYMMDRADLTAPTNKFVGFCQSH